MIRRDDTRLWVAFCPFLLRMTSVMRIVGGSVGRAAPSASKSRSVVNLKYPIEHGIVTNWDDTERNLASFFPAPVGRPRHRGRHGPKGQPISASLMKKPAESTTLQGFVRQCRVGRWHDHVPGNFLVASSGHDRCHRPSGPSACVRRPQPLGGDPSSLWTLRELQSLEALRHRRRRADYLCRIDDSDQMRPLGILTHLSTVFSSTKGTSADGTFLSQSHIGMGSVFWSRCLSGMESSNSFGEGGSLWLSAQAVPSHLHAASSHSLATAVSSLDTLKTLWKPCNISRVSLRELRRKHLFSRSLKFQDLDLSCIVSSVTPTPSDAGISGSGIAAVGTAEMLSRHPIRKGGTSARFETRALSDTSVCTSASGAVWV